jgi:ribosomal protein S18 acetylase RimI-like enzyme
MAGTDPWIRLGITLEQTIKICHDPRYGLFIALDREKPAGMIVIDDRGLAGSPYIKTIAVAEEYRGKGIGSQMILFTEALYRKEYRHLFLCVSSFNLKARQLYERLGFVRVGELPDYIIEGASEIIMYKRLP